MIRQHPVIVSVCLVALLGATWFFLFQSSESDKYNSELGFDLVRLVAAVHELDRNSTATGQEAKDQRQAAWQRIRFVLSRWEAEMDRDRREVIKLMKRAVVAQPTFDEHWMQQYSGRIIMTDIGRGEERFPLYRAASRVMQDNLLHLSDEERRRLAQFVDTVFAAELELVRRSGPEQLAKGGEEAMIAAHILQDYRH